MAGKKRDLNSEYWKWRAAILKRDKNKCRYPGCRCRTRLQIHHIIRWADCYELRYNVDNGISLCRKHHKLITGHEYIYAPVFMSIVRRK